MMWWCFTRKEREREGWETLTMFEFSTLHACRMEWTRGKFIDQGGGADFWIFLLKEPQMIPTERAIILPRYNFIFFTQKNFPHFFCSFSRPLRSRSINYKMVHDQKTEGERIPQHQSTLRFARDPAHSDALGAINNARVISPTFAVCSFVFRISRAGGIRPTPEEPIYINQYNKAHPLIRSFGHVREPTFPAQTRREGRENAISGRKKNTGKMAKWGEHDLKSPTCPVLRLALWISRSGELTTVKWIKLGTKTGQNCQ